jgi:hypothetical protein
VHVTSGAAIFKLALWWLSVCLHYTATYRIFFIALVTCLPTYRTMARYFEFLSQFYGFHLTHPRMFITLERWEVGIPGLDNIYAARYQIIRSVHKPNHRFKHGQLLNKQHCRRLDGMDRYINSPNLLKRLVYFNIIKCRMSNPHSKFCPNSSIRYVTHVSITFSGLHFLQIGYWSCVDKILYINPQYEVGRTGRPRCSVASRGYAVQEGSDT